MQKTTSKNGNATRTTRQVRPEGVYLDRAQGLECAHYTGPNASNVPYEMQRRTRVRSAFIYDSCMLSRVVVVRETPVAEVNFRHAKERNERPGTGGAM